MHRTRRSWFWKVIDVSEPDWLLHLQKTAKILRQSRWTTGRLFNVWRNGNECVLHLHHLLGTRLTIRGSLCSGLCGWLHLHPLEHHRIADTDDSPLPGRCQGEYLANDEGNAWKSEFFFLKLFEVAQISFQRFQRFKLLTDRTSGDQPGSQGIGAGVGLFLCFIAFQSSEGTFLTILTDALEVF